MTTPSNPLSEFLDVADHGIMSSGGRDLSLSPASGRSVTTSALKVNGLPIGLTASFSIATGGSNISLVTIQIVDTAGKNVAAIIPVDAYLSDASTGIGLTATTASGAVAAGASGTDLGALTTKKAIRAVTDATGQYVLSITDSAKTHFYLAVVVGGQVVVSTQLADGSYG